ncbi:ABC transporter permease subunit [Agrobacterium rubi]|uniref:ABC transporter permease subunit n=2 Tax=Rhizobium/Agrobacterium group TaxID=227290 RepID=A0AAE7RFY5_9HYPH|nr:ABC transporter permease subunit [Agrobacterium rubi]MBN7807812.1 ABC transporter permease subunit [Agrobacterium rosae]NTE89771.1 ABC transporter permease subunit [Agrobacterium rubi]NTF05379.1 ABC transporter permease subunit [Agrobacterium rubi]NTF39823.1 ABC transporter permease subunit [Agrobacterium rubi]OCJ44985.1 nickel permease [Agrobacterium rubi]
MDLSWLSAYGALLIAGLGTTLSLLALSAIFGFTLAVPVALMRLSSRRLISIPAAFYTSVIRGTPLLVQIYIFYYGLGSLFTMFPSIRASFLWPYLREGYWYVVFALILSVAAYVGEILRGGLLSVPRGEIEAARAFGMTHWQVLIRVRLPRAIGFLLPTLAGETVMLLKSTALASTVAVVDLLGAANLVRSQTFQIYSPLLLVATIYLGLTLVIETCFAQLKSDSVFNFHRHARKKP